MQDRFLAIVTGIALWIALFFSGLFFWLSPLALFYIAKRHSIKISMMVWFVSTSLILLAYQTVFSHLPSEVPKWLLWLPAMGYFELFGKEVVLNAVLIYSVFFGLIGFILSLRAGKEKKVVSLMTTLVFGSSVVTFFVLLILIQGDFSLFIGSVHQYFLTALDQFISLNKAAGLEGEELLFLQQNREMIASSMLRILPAVLVSLTIFLSWLNLVVAKKLFGHLKYLGELQELFTFRIPFYFIWVVISCLTLFLLNVYFVRLEKLEFLLLNFFIVFLTLYFFQGLSIISFYLAVKRLASWIRLLCYSLLLLFIQPFGILLIVVGFFDSWFNFRKL